jgi:chromosome segregation ATPase
MSFTPAQRERVLAEARANLSDRREPVARRESCDIIFKTTEEALMTERSDATTDATTAWAAWVDETIDARIAAAIEGIGQALGEHVASLQRQIELLEREVNQLRAHVALERGLEELQGEIDAARRQIPALPKIVERLEAGQSRLRREVADAKEKLGSLRVDQSLTTYRLDELGKARTVDKSRLSERLDELCQANEETAAKIDTIFPMQKIHPDAGAALRNYAAEALKNETIYQLDPGMFDAQTQPAASGPEECTTT